MALEQRDNSKLLWGIIAALVCIVALVAAYFWISTMQKDPINEKPATTVTAPVAPVTPKPPVAQPIEQAPVTNTLIDEKVLKDPIPDTPVAAEEEVAKLDDLQQQLVDQESVLKEQHQSADDLIKLKEEQIKLLEQQLAEQK